MANESATMPTTANKPTANSPAKGKGVQVGGTPLPAVEPAKKKSTESKADRFTRLAVARMTKVLKALTRLQNLGSKANYEYTPAQAERIILALTNAVGNVKRAFETQSDKAAEFEF